ncbi:MAG: hypothetical protein HeimC3_45820 [Candidatus Heimdallarchaeota archaeon LC_3]|nr:MAG: hypothetical protein HeimC3_45820 [Candidatus Heimdallarchaeota archaeon LC_3]
MMDQLDSTQELLREGRLNQAQNILKTMSINEIHDQNSKSILKYYLLSAKILEKQGKYSQGYSTLSKMFSIPKFSLENINTSDKTLMKIFLKAKILSGRLLRYNGKISESAKEFEETLNLSTEMQLLTPKLAAISEFGFVKFLTGDNTAAMNLTNQGFSLVKFLSNPIKERYWIYHFFNLRSIIDYYQGKYQGAIVNLIRVIATGKEFNDRELLCIAHNMLSAAYRVVGEFELSLEQAEIALKLAEEVNDQFLKAKSISNNGLVLINIGEFDQGVKLLNEALAIDQESNNLMDQPITLGNISKAFAVIGDRMKAIETFQETLKLYKLSNIEVEIVDKYCNFIDILLEKGDTNKAKEILDECKPFVKKHNSDMDNIKFKLREGMCFKALGQSENARRLFTEARTLAETIDQYKDTIRASIYLAEIDLEQTLTKGLDEEYIKKAFVNVDKAHFLSERTGLFPNIVKTLLIRGSLYGARLEFKEALETLNSAIKITEEKNFLSLHRQVLELYDRLKQRQTFIRPDEEKQWQDIGMNEVLTYIRLMTGRLPSLPLNVENLDPFYILSFIFGATGHKNLYNDNIPKEIIESDQEIDQNYIAIFFSSILGGNQYNEGLFGPMPVPNAKSMQALVFTQKTSEKNNDQNPLFWMTIIAYPKSFDPLFYNRFEIEKTFNEFCNNTEIKKDNYDKKYFLDLKNSLKLVIQKQIKDRLKSYF